MTTNCGRNIAPELLVEEICLNDQITTHHSVKTLYFSLAEAQLSGDNIRGVWCWAEENLRACFSHYRTKFCIAWVVILSGSEERHMTFTTFLHDLADWTRFGEVLILNLVDEHIQRMLIVLS